MSKSIRMLLKATNPCNGCQREEHDRFGPCKNFEHCPTLRAHIELRHEVHKLQQRNKVLKDRLKMSMLVNKNRQIGIDLANGKDYSVEFTKKYMNKPVSASTFDENCIKEKQ